MAANDRDASESPHQGRDTSVDEQGNIEQDDGMHAHKSLKESNGDRVNEILKKQQPTNFLDELKIKSEELKCDLGGETMDVKITHNNTALGGSVGLKACKVNYGMGLAEDAAGGAG